MGMLVNGTWQDKWYKPDSKGKFVRPETVFRNQISKDGSSGFPAEAGRYHVYVSYACPWASRVLMVRAYKKLENAISVSAVSPFMGKDGWEFSEKEREKDPFYNLQFLREVYLKADREYTGRVTVPILWDKTKQTIVNNESREIIRMLDRAFHQDGDTDTTLCPASLEKEVDQAITAIYEPINNGVYRAGFATTQEAYEEAVTELFLALDHWENVLGKQRYLCGERLTEADICLFTTLIRFDMVYHGHFKCNLRRLVEYPNLWDHTKKLYQLPNMAKTVNFSHIKKHYYWSHETINPIRIVPKGPEIDEFLAKLQEKSQR